MRKKLQKTYDWMGGFASSPYANYLLGFLFYIEAIFFLPTDPILIIYCLERRDRAFTYALIATIGSVLGGITMYSIGALLWDTVGDTIIHAPIVNMALSPENFMYLKGIYQQYEWWAVCATGLVPVPYKATALTAGFCKLNMLTFIAASTVARGSRFFLYAFVCKLFGHHIKDSVNKYFNIIILATFIIITVIIWMITK